MNSGMRAKPPESLPAARERTPAEQMRAESNRDYAIFAVVLVLLLWGGAALFIWMMVDPLGSP